MNVERLKEQARNHEMREEWKKAYDLYRAALRNEDEEEPTDITLYNRVGDIQTRMGEIAGAVEHYEKAIELYLEAELPNNAIAICKKVLRNLPNKTVFFLRMGQIRASQGFLSDARHNYLTYAEKQTQVGKLQEALDALLEFVEISPEDVEIRLALAGQLESQDRGEEAIEQYTLAYRKLVLGNRDEEALAIAEKLGELAPDLDLEAPEAILEAETSTTPDEGDFVVESTSLGGLEFSEWDEEPPEHLADGASDHEALGEARVHEDVSAAEAEVEPMAARGDPFVEETHPGQALESELPGRETLEEAEGEDESELLPSFDFEGEGVDVGVVQGDESIPEGADLPFLDFDDVDSDEETEDTDGRPEPLPEGADLPFLDSDDVGLDDEPGDTDSQPEPLPTLDHADTSVLPPLFPETEEELAAPPSPQPEEFLSPPETHQDAAERGDLDLAMEMVSALIEADPDEVTHHQRLVEYAFRSSDDSVLIPAYLGLAGCLGRTGSPVKAKAVYQQVLAFAPGHHEAETGMRALEGSAAPSPPPQVASSEEYVDLGSMILGEEPEKTTRWRVQADAPSGDDAADFARMLGQFKEKVSEHVSADDVSAHHDLGTAYMEMGLLDEAVGEFQMALRASPGHLPTHEVMGRCWLDLGKPDMAIRALRRALQAPYDVEDELIGIYYLIGRASEQVGNASEAVEFYEKVFSLDINFQDVTERLRALR